MKIGSILRVIILIPLLSAFQSARAADATMSWIASSDLDGDNLWKTIEEPDIVGLAWDFGSPKSPSFGVANLPGVTAWYNSPAATMQSFNDAPLSAAPFGQTTNQPASFELVFRPGDLVDNHVLFETGGSVDGMGFVINGDLLEFRAQDANTDEQRIILNHIFSAGEELNFHHIVATVQTGAPGTNQGILYVNGVQVQTFEATGDVLDWAGGDDAGLGALNGSTSTGQNNFSAFTGDIAILRFYAGVVLTGAEVLELYDALAGGDSDTDDDDLPDAWETFYFEDLDEVGTGNTDGDGLTHAQELAAGTNPTKADTDDDGTNDDVELTGGANPYTAGVLGATPGDPTNPNAPDSDSDGVNDGAEPSSTNGSVSDPNNPDTDGDGVLDGPEIALGRNPTDPNDGKTGLAGGLVAYWPFENASLEDVAHSSGATDSGIADDGTFTGPATDVGFDITGKFGDSSLLQNGEAGWVTVPKSSDTIGNGATNSVSVSAWVKVDAFDIAWQAAVSHGEGAFWRIARNNANTTMAYAGGGGDIFSTTDFTPPTGWMHLVVVTDNGTSRLFVNGAEESSGNVNLNTSLAAAPDPMIGNNPERLARIWEGSIDDVAIWNRPLTQAEVDSIYAGGDGASIADLIGIGDANNFRITQFSFDEATGDGSITWNSKETKTYRVTYTTDLGDWGGELIDSTPGTVGSDTTTFPFNRSQLFGATTAPRVQIRVEEVVVEP